jgi:hypothetical protein
MASVLALCFRAARFNNRAGGKMKYGEAHFDELAPTMTKPAAVIKATKLADALRCC